MLETVSYAKKKPISDRPLQRRAHRAGDSSAPVYVTVLRCDSRQDRAARGRRTLQRRHRCSPRYSTPDCSHAIRISRPRLGASLTCMNRVGLGRPLSAREFVISADEKSSIQAPAASSLRWLPRLVVPPESNTNISVKALGRIWPRGAYIAPRCSAAAKRKAALPSRSSDRGSHEPRAL
jgi:hypothetical protein